MDSRGSGLTGRSTGIPWSVPFALTAPLGNMGSLETLSRGEVAQSGLKSNRSGPSAFSRYGVAVGTVSLATLLRWLLRPAFGDYYPYAPFFAAIAVSAWYGGLLPGLASMVLGSVSVLSLFIPRGGLSGAAGAEHWLGLAAYLLVGFIIIILSEGLHRAKRRAERQESTLRENQEELDDFFENVALPLHWVGLDGTILRANRAELAFLGYSREEYVGHSITEFHVDRQVIDDILDRLRRGEAIKNYPARVRARDGSFRDVLITSNTYQKGGRFIHTRCFTYDITERLRLEEARNRLAAIVESSDDAIIGKDLNGIILAWNVGAERIFGYTAEEIVGRSVTVLIPPERLAEETSILDRLKRGERVDHFETVRLRKDGTPVDISLTVSPIKDSQGRVVGASKISRDITERKRLDEERAHLLENEQAARQMADHANRLKDEFLATLSHELRTPLNAILGWATLLRSGKLRREELEHGYEVIERNARNQAQLIEDLLDMSRIMSGKIHLELGRLELAPIIEAAIEAVTPAADAKGIVLEHQFDPGAGTVKGDPTRIQQVVWNLLANGIKFTPRGGRVTVKLEGRGSQVEIQVSDTGMGIKPEFLPHLFERFRQADSSTTRQYGGLGLGLGIVRDLVEAHGGTVSAESGGEGLGSTFKVRLPASVEPLRYKKERHWQGSPQHEPVTSLSVSLNGVKVLLVDDEQDTLDLLKRILEEYEAEVVTAGSAVEAMRLLKLSRPHVLVSDIGMPIEDGYSLLGKVRSIAPELPAIALTAYAGKEDRSRSIKSGFQAHLTKPVDSPSLIAVLAQLTGRR
jgi:PAS domain S-box-containing protein